MSEYEWTCAGCGVPSPNKVRACACPTNVVCWDRKQEWKIDATEGASLAIATRNATLADKLEARLHRDRHGKVDPELGVRIDSGLCNEIFQAVAALRATTVSNGERA